MAYHLALRDGDRFTLEVFMDDVDSPDVTFVADAATIELLESALEELFF